MDARNAGIETIYQDLALATNMNSADNIFLGREITRKFVGFIPVLNRKKMQQEAKSILNELDIEIHGLTRPTRELSGGQRQAVAISRSIYWNAKLLDVYKRQALIEAIGGEGSLYILTSTANVPSDIARRDGCIEAVSYTHLDVYKRQVCNC